jgi:hypothetical protein
LPGPPPTSTGSGAACVSPGGSPPASTRQHSGHQAGLAADLSCTDSTQDHGVDGEHQPMDLAVGGSVRCGGTCWVRRCSWVGPRAVRSIRIGGVSAGLVGGAHGPSQLRPARGMLRLQRAAVRSAEAIGGHQQGDLLPGLLTQTASLEGESSTLGPLPELLRGLTEVWIDVAADHHCGWDRRSGSLQRRCRALDSAPVGRCRRPTAPGHRWPLW